MPDIEEMLEDQLKGRGIRDHRILKAMAEVPRELFVPAEWRHEAYADRPLPIGHGQTISQPYIVAFMAEALNLGRHDKILEIGTGSGYQAAVFSRLARKVISLEIVEPLVRFARANLDSAGINNVEVHLADGHAGYPEEAPYDMIVLTAAPRKVPPALKRQLRTGGRLMAPVGGGKQYLRILQKTAEQDFVENNLLSVSFVPMTGGKNRE